MQQQIGRVGPTAAAVLLPPALAALRATAPALLVRFTELEPPEAEHAVRSGDADVGLVFRHDLDTDPPPGDVLREPLARDPVRLVLPAGRAAPDGLAALDGEPWIAGCPRCRAHLLRSAAVAGFTPDIRFTTDDHVVVQRLVAQGLGVALLPGWALDASRQAGVVAVEVPGVDDRIVEIVMRPETRRVPAAAALVRAVRVVARGLV